MKSIANKLEIYEKYVSYEKIPAQLKGWITIKAREQGKNPANVHAGIKARYARRHNVIYGYGNW